MNNLTGNCVNWLFRLGSAKQYFWGWLSSLSCLKSTWLLTKTPPAIKVRHILWQSRRSKSKSWNKKSSFQPLLTSYLAIANWPKCQFPTILYHNILHIVCVYICLYVLYMSHISYMHTHIHNICISYDNRG